MLKFAVCDDEQDEIDKIKYIIQQYSIKKDIEVEVDCFCSGENLLENYEKGKYNIIFLDVEMGNMDGIMTAEKIRRIPDHDVVIMYVSSYPEYMQSGFDVRAAQYFSKPLSYDAFEIKVDKALKYLIEDKERVITFGNMSNQYYINVRDILMIEAEKGIKNRQKLHVITKNDEFITSGRLKDYALQVSAYFIEPNRSTLVNVLAVYKFEHNEIILCNKMRISISRQRVQQIKSEFARIMTKVV